MNENYQQKRLDNRDRSILDKVHKHKVRWMDTEITYLLAEFDRSLPYIYYFGPDLIKMGRLLERIARELNIPIKEGEYQQRINRELYLRKDNEYSMASIDCIKLIMTNILLELQYEVLNKYRRDSIPKNGIAQFIRYLQYEILNNGSENVLSGNEACHIIRYLQRISDKLASSLSNKRRETIMEGLSPEQQLKHLIEFNRKEAHKIEQSKRKFPERFPETRSERRQTAQRPTPVESVNQEALRNLISRIEENLSLRYTSSPTDKLLELAPDISQALALFGEESNLKTSMEQLTSYEKILDATNSDLRRLRSLIYRAERCQVLLDNGDSFRKVVKITKNVNELESIRDGVIRNIKQLVNLGVITSKAANAKIKKYSPDELIKDIQQIAKEHNKINPDAIETIYKALENLKNRYNAPSIKVVTIDIPRDKPESNHLREKYSRSPTSPKRRR